MENQDFEIEKVTTPVLVIGAGAAGARAAIGMKQNGVTPLVVSKRDHGDAHTTWARGGINAALGNLDSEDSWEIHAADTLDEGHYINDTDAVEAVTKNMPDVAEELHDWGMDFTLTDDGKINQRYFGAQSFRRTCFAGDYTGEALLNTLVDKAQELGIPYRDNLFITKILKDGDKVTGAIGYDIEDEHYVVFKSDRVVLAAGGHTAVYNRHSSRDDENTGDGVGLAYEAGAELMDMEFIQFHPTGMVGDRYGEEWDGRLVTEAVRGEGGRLYNSEGERFMEKYSPDQMELDARDVVARAIEQEVREGRGTENGGVYLDISHRDEEFIRERLPRMYERFQSLGVNISEEPMEVAPTAHYAMGGVKYDAQTGKADVENLHVVGETTAGVHGANRLGGNSLAETVAIGKLVGEHIAQLSPTEPVELNENEEEILENEVSRIGEVLNSDGEYSTEEIAEDIRDLMEEYAGIRRSADRIKEGLSSLEDVKDMYKDIKVESDMSSLEFEMANNIRFMLIAAESTLRGALERNESRGAHYRTDYTNKDSSQRHNITYFNQNEQMNLGRRGVREPTQSVQEAVEQGYELDYHHLE
jgi:succinate dehydrogenase / fumarate reductase flavoprotein subunit